MLPVKVRVHVTTLEETVGWLHVAVMPLGSPETIDGVAPVPSAGTVTPPLGVAVTVTVPVPIDSIPRFIVFIDTLTPGVAAHSGVAAQERKIAMKARAR
jgi:hypothetical protein